MVRKMRPPRLYSSPTGSSSSPGPLRAVPVFKEDPATEKEEAEYYRIVTFTIPRGHRPRGRGARVDAGRPARRLDPPGRDLPGRQPRGRRPRRERSSPGSPTDCTRCSAWRIATAGSTSPSAASCRGSRTATATARPIVFETVSDAWEINGDYHEYAFGSKFDRDGYLWVALCLTGSFTSENKFRGWGLADQSRGQGDPDAAAASARPAGWA